jgi:hypothetical protein
MLEVDHHLVRAEEFRDGGKTLNDLQSAEQCLSFSSVPKFLGRVGEISQIARKFFLHVCISFKTAKRIVCTCAGIVWRQKEFPAGVQQF